MRKNPSGSSKKAKQTTDAVTAAEDPADPIVASSDDSDTASTQHESTATCPLPPAQAVPFISTASNGPDKVATTTVADGVVTDVNTQ